MWSEIIPDYVYASEFNYMRMNQKDVFQVLTFSIRLD